VTGYDPQTRQYVRTEAQYLSSGKGAKFGDMQHPNRIGYKHTTVQSEEFADMFMAWSLRLFNTNLSGQAGRDYMNSVMPGYVPLAVNSAR